MTTRFADSFYYLALLNPADEAHDKASSIPVSSAHRIITTPWVLVEVADALSSPRYRVGAARFLRVLRRSNQTLILSPSLELFDRGLELYETRKDKEWSLTDCISFVVMKDQGLLEALTADHHFEQAGFVALLK